jgi:hypothetical protein
MYNNTMNMNMNTNTIAVVSAPVLTTIYSSVPPPPTISCMFSF